MLISELAEGGPGRRRCDITRRGLLPPAVRTASGYRSYDDGAGATAPVHRPGPRGGSDPRANREDPRCSGWGTPPCAHVRDLLDRQLVARRNSSQRGSIFCVPPSPGLPGACGRQLRRPARNDLPIPLGLVAALPAFRSSEMNPRRGCARPGAAKHGQRRVCRQLDIPCFTLHPDARPHRAGEVDMRSSDSRWEPTTTSPNPARVFGDLTVDVPAGCGLPAHWWPWPFQ